MEHGEKYEREGRGGSRQVCTLKPIGDKKEEIVENEKGKVEIYGTEGRMMREGEGRRQQKGKQANAKKIRRQTRKGIRKQKRMERRDATRLGK